MGKSSFIQKLEALLSKVPEHDRKEMLYDFEEHFVLGLADGRTEEELVSELGDPNMIAKDLLADYRITRAESNHSLPNIFNAIVAAVSLSFLNLIFVLGPVIGFVSVYVGLCATAIILTISPLAVLGYIIFHGFDGIVTIFFVSLVTCGLGILLSVAMMYIGKFLYNGILRYIKFNISVIKGERGEKA